MSAAPRDRITIRGLQVFAHHGVLPEEATLGQRFVLDITAWLDLASAARDDDPELTVSYADIATAATAALTRRRFRLIEAAAQAVVDALFALDPRLLHLEVTLHKPAAPVPQVFADIAVTLDRRRPDPD